MISKKNTLVETKAGKVEGSFENSVYVFKGVPYAAPPVKELRWLPPQPIKPWQGVRAAKSFGPIAPQIIRPSATAVSELHEPESISEDCLFLNIWTPGLDSNRRPVMVRIHGGGFSMGSGSQSVISGDKLALNGNVVVVTINYRLGILGFMNLNEITKGRIPSTGNEGLLDQIAALEWVRNNIAAFGGDPENITMFGESAGAMSIGCLMIMPAAKGLFQKAILESPVGELARPLEQSLKIPEEFLDVVRVKADDVNSLRAIPVERILSSQQEVAIRTGASVASVMPVADGKVMPMMPLKSLDAGLAARVPTLAGSNLDEDKFFALMSPRYGQLDEAGLLRRVQRLVPTEEAPKIIDVYRQGRLKRGEPASPADIFSAINTDLMYRKTALRVAEAQCKHSAPAYNYLFTWKSAAMGGAFGACHTLETGFIFGSYDSDFCGGGPEAEKLSYQIQDAWTTFARTGNPSCQSLGEWPQYCSDRQTMILGRSSHVEMAVFEEERHIWEVIGATKIGSDAPSL